MVRPIRNVSKNQILQQDIAIGIGRVTQTRRGREVTGDRLAIPVNIPDLNALALLDPQVANLALVPETANQFVIYRYVASDSSGAPVVPPYPGSWIPQNASSDTIISETPPNLPSEGNRWINCANWKSYSWSGAEWVEDNPSVGAGPEYKVKDSHLLGVAGDYDPVTNTGTDDTVAMQSIFANLTDGDTIKLTGNILIDRDSAVIQTVQGVSSYILVADGVKNLKVTGAGVIYQRYNALDTVGVCFIDCDDLHLDNAVFDGNFRYTSTTPISFSQQLLHIISCKRSTGSFTVRNSSNYGFCITNQFGELDGYKQGEINNSVFTSVISENCLQNTTFGTGVNTAIINSFVCLNPITAAIKFSSRLAAGVDRIFKGLRIDNFSCNWDSTYQNPRNAAGTAPNNALSVLDNVSQALDCSYGYCYIDLANVTISSSALKQACRDSTTFGPQPNGPVTVDTLIVRNQTGAGSAAVLLDAEAQGIKIGTLDLENVGRGLQVTTVEPNAAAQPKASKFIDVDKLVVRDNTKAILTVADYDADYIRVGRIEQREANSDQQSVYIDSSCNLNSLTLPDLDVQDNMSINGVVNGEIVLKGKVDASLRALTPVNVNLSSKSGELQYDLDVTGDGLGVREVFINNVATVRFGAHSLKGCPQGIDVRNADRVKIADTSPVYEDLTVQMPFQFDSTVVDVHGVVEYTGSPTNTLYGSSGLMYRRNDEAEGTAFLYIKILSTESSSRLLGWRKLATV